MRLILEEQQKFSSDKCFICFISDCPHYIWWKFIIIPKYEHIIAPHVLSTSIFTRIVQKVLCWFRNQHNTVCTILVRINVLNTCGAITCLFFGIAFLLLFKHIENAVCTSFQNSMLLFINGLILDIMNIKNNQSLEFELIPMFVPLRFVNDWSFLWLRNDFLKSFQDRPNSIQQYQRNLLARKRSYRGKHMNMKDWK